MRWGEGGGGGGFKHFRQNEAIIRWTAIIRGNTVYRFSIQFHFLNGALLHYLLSLSKPVFSQWTCFQSSFVTDRKDGHR